MLAGSLDGTGRLRYSNLASSGARMRCVRDRQLPAALRQRPEAVAMTVGMNDALRADFDPAALHDDLDTVIGTLHDAGATVVTTRFHDHGQVFRLPGPLSRALRRRAAGDHGPPHRLAAAARRTVAAQSWPGPAAACRRNHAPGPVRPGR